MMDSSNIEFNGNIILTTADVTNNKKAVLDVEGGPSYGGSTAASPSTVRATLLSVVVVMLKIGVVVVLAGLIGYYMGWLFVLQLLIVALVAYLAAGGGYRWFYVAFKTLPRDTKAVFRYIGLLLQVKSYERNNMTISEIFRQRVADHPDKVCFMFEDTVMTFAQVEEYSNKVANIFKDHGYMKGDVVAVYLENRPEFVCLWLGLTKLGVIVPLINYNLRNHSLIHSLTVANCQAVIFGSELTDAMKEVRSSLSPNIALYCWSASSTNLTSELGEKNLTSLIAEASSSPPVLKEKLNYNDRLIYIYTSGTTGLPKAAVITNSRFIFIATGIGWIAGFRRTDRFYTPLPLYHTAGGVMSIGQAIIFGSTIVIRNKFSASSYFADCKKYECTVSQYIGEMARYILAVPPKPEDKDHKIRIIFGNGLRPQIWKEFVSRFNIPNVAEFYGATEGNANIVNIDNKVGAIGFLSRIIPAVYPISIIRVDPATGDPIRNAKGLCMVCKPDEPGVFIGKINPNNPTRAFLGYVDKGASEKKIVRNVFAEGDSAFISGDILVADEFGYLYFKDRTGDTFRWKGENVSTSEVEAVISNVVGFRDAIVYGVEVSSMEGRAGMVAIMDNDNTLDLNILSDGIKKSLPSYARPLFIRALKKVDLTGTFKLKKTVLQEEGFSPSVVKDNLYYLTSNGSYDTLTEKVYSDICSGKIRL